MMLPPELWFFIFNLLKDRPGLLRQVCREWKAIVDVIFKKKPSLIQKSVSVESVSLLDWSKRDLPWNEETCAAAAEGGHLHIIQWARANGCPWDRWTCAWAADNGHFEVLQWARENGCPCDTRPCSRAAQKGHLDILQWARENGCPWDESTCACAAYGGHLEVLQWARMNDCPE